jgi:hypothetical protein
MTRRVDREKIERATRECRLVLDAERNAREAKTARLKKKRLQLLAVQSREPEPAIELKIR